MIYKEFIKVNEGFQYSINLQYDLNKYSKITGYIPTNASVEILKSYLTSIYYDSKDRASILVGPYGKGKSHLLLIILAIISMKNEAEEQRTIDFLCNKIGNIDVEVKQMILEIRGQNKKLLPVIINSNYYDLNQAFLVAIKDALEREGLSELKPKTYFESIIETITIWKNEYAETYKIFKEKLKEKGITIKLFKDKINNYDDNAFEIFKEIHPKITSGTEFNPLINSDIIRLFEEINSKLFELGNYTGIFVVFDEFSKFLEASVTRNSARDIKLIQDFAELANRSGKNQIHLCCITHKSVNDYISNLPKEKIDAWRGVEGRFKELYFASSSQQNYELIANAIIKDQEKFRNFKDINNYEITRVLDECESTSIFNDTNNYSSLIGDGCFPLNPISSYVLPRVSEKVAQNERTLFTFLAKDEKGSLVNFLYLNKGKADFLTIDFIYDYFETLFKKEVFNESVHTIWLKANNALSKTKDKIQRKIIKSLAVINIVNEFERLSPTDLYIRASLGLTNDIFESAITQLVNKQIILRKKSDGIYRFLPGSDLDIIKKITDRKSINSNKINVKEILDNIVSLSFELPKKYNDEKEMVRYFKKEFITVNEFLNIRTIKDLTFESNSDGVILYLIHYSKEEKEKALKKLVELNDSRILVCILNSNFSKDEEIRELLAIKSLKNDVEFNQNELAAQELEIFEEDVTEDIENYINVNYDVKNGLCGYYDFHGERLDIKKVHQLNRKISDICFEVFSNTPVVNNELINKNKISSPILKARDKIIQYIFEEMEKGHDFVTKGNGPETTIFRVAIKRKGLLDGTESNDQNLNEILDVIKNFILSSEEKKKSFSDLYDIFYNAEFKYGLRSGIIPIYLALKMKDYLDKIVIYFGEKEVPLSVETLNRINETPNKYFILLEEGSKEKENYIINLDNLFNEYKSKKEAGYSRYTTILESIQSWIYGLPKYSKDCQIASYNKYSNIDFDIIQFRKLLLKFDSNPRDLLLNKLPNKIFNKNSLEQCFTRITVIKNLLDNFIVNTKKYLILETKEIFEKGYKGEFKTALENWYKDLDKDNIEHLYDVNSNAVLKLMPEISKKNDDYIIEKLAKIVTGLSIEDWQDDTVKQYLHDIQEIKDTITNYKKEEKIKNNHSYNISFFINDKQVNKSFESTDISVIGKTLYDNIEEAFDDYAESIDVNEKRNILMKLLEKYM
ncbi:hypothetical protein FDA09_00615 [Clostridium botulinum]|uniref:hypothetical protein n=1 Tax=Clostridium botulinum TaxID=1491 RepID=UPI0007743DF3|nr:hypothetical protein [Clostridium botulinum]NFH80187.1 hypothetical protein [Clostridium botulinum]NFH81920.1 hypothetical protein [Clostridium botulinum]NFI09894.1 hypothetical protein [Clostridium botulinum]NFI14953.1 hypothetical protein [Clostridium botulinum]NFO85035.1 hypothetical protein [Clostridium botulinum]